MVLVVGLTDAEVVDVPLEDADVDGTPTKASWF